MQRGLGDAVGLQRVGDLGQLRLGDHQIAHHHHAVVVLGEGHVTAQGQTCLDRDPLGDHVQVGAGQRNPVNGAVVTELSAAAQDGGDGSPVGRGSGNGLVGSGRGLRIGRGGSGGAAAAAAGQYQQPVPSTAAQCGAPREWG